MNLGKTLVGGIIGAAIAIAIYTVLKTQMHLEASWFPIVTGLLTGLGVRQAHKSLSNNVSYMRGAVAGIIAALAILGAEEVVKMVLATDGRTTIAQAPPVAPPDDEVEVDDDAAVDDQPLEVEEPERRVGPRGVVGDRSGVKPTRDDMWPFIFMAVGIFLAYELARGSAGPKTVDHDSAVEPGPDAPATSGAEVTTTETTVTTEPADQPPRDDQGHV